SLHKAGIAGDARENRFWPVPGEGGKVIAVKVNQSVADPGYHGQVARPVSRAGEVALDQAGGVHHAELRSKRKRAVPGQGFVVVVAIEVAAAAVLERNYELVVSLGAGNSRRGLNERRNTAHPCEDWFRAVPAERIQVVAVEVNQFVADPG